MHRYLLLALAVTSTGLHAAEPAQPEHAGQPFVVFDIDGTLTPHNLLVFRARPDAARVASALAASGFTPVYLSTRIDALQDGLPDWLARHGFPAGALHTAQTAAEHDDPAGYKLGVLRAYQQKGWTLAMAFGDSPTDFEAYRKAGLARERVFALQRKWNRHCESGDYGQCLKGWDDYLQRYGARAPAFVQP